MHPRQSIRDNLVTTLTGLTTTAARVYRSRVYPMDASKLPGLCLYTKTERSSYNSMGSNRVMERTLTVGIDIHVKGLTNYDDLLDTISLEVEQALVADRTRGGYARDTRVIDFQAEFSGEGAQPLAIGVLTVEIDYQTKELTPETSV